MYIYIYIKNKIFLCLKKLLWLDYWSIVRNYLKIWSNKIIKTISLLLHELLIQGCAVWPVKSIFHIHRGKLSCQIWHRFEVKLPHFSQNQADLILTNSPCEPPLSGETPAAAGHCCCCCCGCGLGLVSFQPSLPPTPLRPLVSTVPEGITPLLFCNLSRGPSWPWWRKKASKVQTSTVTQRFPENTRSLSLCVCTKAFMELRNSNLKSDATNLNFKAFDKINESRGEMKYQPWARRQPLEPHMVCGHTHVCVCVILKKCCKILCNCCCFKSTDFVSLFLMSPFRPAVLDIIKLIQAERSLIICQVTPTPPPPLFILSFLWATSELINPLHWQQCKLPVWPCSSHILKTTWNPPSTYNTVLSPQTGKHSYTPGTWDSKVSPDGPPSVVSMGLEQPMTLNNTYSWNSPLTVLSYRSRNSLNFAINSW